MQLSQTVRGGVQITFYVNYGFGNGTETLTCPSGYTWEQYVPTNSKFSTSGQQVFYNGGYFYRDSGYGTEVKSTDKIEDGKTYYAEN